MYVMTLNVESRHDVEDILTVLSNAEEEGELNFAFGVKTEQLSKDGNYVLETV